MKNRSSNAKAAPLTPGAVYEVDWDPHATDYVFAAGHQLGIVLVANDPDDVSVDPKAGTVVVKIDRTNGVLPIAP